jgi:hypothetical protein
MSEYITNDTLLSPLSVSRRVGITDKYHNIRQLKPHAYWLRLEE